MCGPRGEETGALVELGGRACWGEAARHKPGGWKERGRASLQDGEDEGGEGRASTQGDPRQPLAEGGFHLSLRGAQNLS